MIRFLGALLLALALPLGGCSTINSAGQAISSASQVKITKTQVYIAANAFNAVKATVTNYVLLPTCKAGQTFVKNQCSSKALIARIVPAVRAGTANRDDLIAYIKTNPNSLGVSGLYTALTSAITTIKAALASEGVAS